jgi:hypothetical protein
VRKIRLNCHHFPWNEVWLCLNVSAYNVGNLWPRLLLPKRVDNGSLTSLHQRLVRTGGWRNMIAITGAAWRRAI